MDNHLHYYGLEVFLDNIKGILTEMIEEFNDNRLPYLMERSDTIGKYIVGAVRANYVDMRIYNDYKEFIFKLYNHISYDKVLEKCDSFYWSESTKIDFKDNSEYICEKQLKYTFTCFNVYEGKYVYPYDESIPVRTIRMLLYMIEAMMTEIKLNLVEERKMKENDD